MKLGRTREQGLIDQLKNAKDLIMIEWMIAFSYNIITKL